MELKIKTFDELTTKELYEILKARVEVFIMEQKCNYQDVDGKDYESIHIFYEDQGKILAYLRVYKKSNDESTMQVGRVLTVERGTGLGRKLLVEAIKVIRSKKDINRIFMEAQTYAVGFYEKEGFEVCSDEFLEDDIPHVEMELKL